MAFPKQCEHVFPSGERCIGIAGHRHEHKEIQHANQTRQEVA